jgi:hypothetical protein
LSGPRVEEGVGSRSYRRDGLGEACFSLKHCILQKGKQRLKEEEFRNAYGLKRSRLKGDSNV